MNMKGVVLKQESEIELIRAASQLVSRTLGEVKKHIAPGIALSQLDRIAEQFIRDNGAEPAFKNYRPDSDHTPFPYTLCLSLNHEVVHGFATDRVLNDGDIISVDCGVKLNGYYGDSAYTFTVGNVDERVCQLLSVTKQALYLAIDKAVEGGRLGDVSAAVQTHVESHGYSVVREMVGHGVGKKLHEPPEVANYGRRGEGMKLKSGLVIAIEPMINLGRKDVVRGNDGWTIMTADGSPSAHFEHTVAVRRGKADILTTFDYIEN